MEGLLALIVSVVALGAFGVLSMTIGSDSRDFDPRIRL